MLGVRDARFSFDIDENEIVMAGPEHGQSLGVAKGRVDVKSLEGQNPIAKGTDRFTCTEVQDCTLAIWKGSRRCVVCHGLR
jgi:hypothetical protein